MSSKGNGYLASPEMQTSTTNQELIPNKQPHWTHGYKVRKLSFNNKQDCKIEFIDVSGKKTIGFLEADQGFEIGYDDPPITSFKIIDANINYNFFATY